MNESNFIKGRSVLVTGACGTIGSTLIKYLLKPEYGPDKVVGIDNNESGLFFLDQYYMKEPRSHFLLADVRDRDKLCRTMRDIDIVFHAAAFKHVIMCERSPFEAVQTNIIGVQNIIYAAFENDVERVIFTSSDKAVNPTNVMGTTKLMGERLITAANRNQNGKRPILTSTRFGNVLGSSGSVVPVFHGQIANGGPVTLTDSKMTRFIMSADEAVKLVIDSVSIARGGEVLITKMPVIRISDLAEVMIEELAPKYGYAPDKMKIVEIGVKAGEKMYEELMTQEEVQRAVELPDYFAIPPAFKDSYKNITYHYQDGLPNRVKNPYISSSEEPLSKSALLSFIKKNNLISSSNHN